jgi:hypothetical protein
MTTETVYPSVVLRELLADAGMKDRPIYIVGVAGPLTYAFAQLASDPTGEAMAVVQRFNARAIADGAPMIRALALCDAAAWEPNLF